MREAVLCLIAAQVGAAIWFGFLAPLVGGSGADSSMAGLLLANVGLWLGYFLGPTLVSRRFGQGPRRDFDISVEPGEAGVAAAAGIGLQLLILPLLYWPIVRLVDADPGESARELVDRVDGPLDILVLVVAVVLVAPLVEEWFYLGMLLPALSRAVGVAGGVIGTSLLFALVHGNLILIPGLTAFGLMVAWFTATTGRIGPAIVAHMTFNATTVVQLLLLA